MRAARAVVAAVACMSMAVACAPNPPRAIPGAVETANNVVSCGAGGRWRVLHVVTGDHDVMYAEHSQLRNPQGPAVVLGVAKLEETGMRWRNIVCSARGDSLVVEATAQRGVDNVPLARYTYDVSPNLEVSTEFLIFECRARMPGRPCE
jgi:hypothetical protein